ncbi:MAG: AraC family transcriptional regulator [Lachnospiraceae bacterium]|nr:AraC family transcriptional regulator [Lachnospiraceae bacterium]
MALFTHSEFQKTIFRHLTFQPDVQNHRTVWANPGRPELGSVLVYERPGCYILSAADYMVPENFSVKFENTQLQLRFGSFYEGKTCFQIEGLAARSSTPTSFLVLEKHTKGIQFWKAGQHFKGVEFTLFPKYLAALEELDPKSHIFTGFPINMTYPALPSTIVSSIWQLSKMTFSDDLTPIILEGILLQCMGTLTQILSKEGFAAFHTQPTAKLGNRTLNFSSADLQSIRQAAGILTENIAAPPSIDELSKRVYLNRQKLEAGFSLCYHMTIGQYIRSCRMAEAARLLAETQLQIQEIGTAVGYTSSASFIKVFRQTYQVTPLAFRKAARES